MESDRYFCLDVLRVSSAGSSKVFCDCAILLEIWDTGGLLQTSNPIAEGSVLDLASAQGCSRAKVNSCTTDAYGCLVDITVDPASNWFPAGYNPPYFKPQDAA